MSQENGHIYDNKFFYWYVAKISSEALEEVGYYEDRNQYVDGESC